MDRVETLTANDRLYHAFENALRHSPFIAMLAVVALLLIGIISNGSDRAIIGMSLFAATIGASYFAMLRVRPARRLVELIADSAALPERYRTVGVLIVGLSATAIAVIHLTFFNGLTLGSTSGARTAIEVALIRMDLTENLPAWMQYSKSIAVNALLPIGLLIATIRRMKWFAVVIAVIGGFYAICMMQKSGPVMLALPVLAYFGCTRRWANAALGLALVVMTVFTMDIIATPELRPAFARSTFHVASEVLPATASSDIAQRAKHVVRPPTPLTKEEDVVPPNILSGLFRRIAIVPGSVASDWFDTVPSDVPYAQGCGYRFLTPFLGCEFQNYSLILYAKFNTTYASTGLRGSSNAASMMTAYANFGMIGIVASGVLHGLLAWGLFALFYKSPDLSPAFNIPYLLMLSSSDLFTTLLSGGWALAVLLYILLCRNTTRDPLDTELR